MKKILANQTVTVKLKNIISNLAIMQNDLNIWNYYCKSSQIFVLILLNFGTNVTILLSYIQDEGLF